MSDEKVVLFCIVVAGCLLELPRPAFAQNAAVPDSIPSDFLELADLRGSLATEIASLQREIAQLQDSLQNAEKWARSGFGSETLARRDSAQLTALTRRTADQDSRLNYAIGYLNDAANAKTAPARIRDLIDAKQKELGLKQSLAKRIRAKISALLDPEQRFKRTMSITFAVLIGLVIAGFFVLALRDDTLRDKVFGGQAGMQFLTLFSLIIAIILFGITGILEGKELSALLGGLSGYILGRSTDAGANTQPANG